jgi:hypothetical protein
MQKHRDSILDSRDNPDRRMFDVACVDDNGNVRG